MSSDSIELDLYLLHWPVPVDFEPTIASYQAAEKLLADGRVRAIGVSNFNPADLDRLLERADVFPAVNQVEIHPFFTQQPVCEVNDRLGIVTQAWSPIGGVYHRYPDAAVGAVKHPLQHPVVIDLAAAHGKTPAQIALRWHIDRGRAAIPKSVHPERIAENIDIFDFASRRGRARGDRPPRHRRAGRRRPRSRQRQDVARPPRDPVTSSRTASSPGRGRRRRSLTNDPSRSSRPSDRTGPGAGVT